MSATKLIYQYSVRLVRREWRRFVLPFLSLLITAVVLTLILLLTNASALLLSEQARELQGGDIVLESNLPQDSAAFFEFVEINPEVVSEQIEFSGTLEHEGQSAPFSIQAVDNNFPLYGSIVLAEGEYEGVNDSQIYLDPAGAERLGVTVGEQVSFGTASYTLAGIIVAEPTSLFGGFRFLPRAIMSISGFTASGIDPNLLRIEYEYAAKVANLSASDRERVRASEDMYGSPIDIDIAGEDRRGLEFGLETVSQFLTVAVLITAVLAAVNVYASTLYLVTVERKSLAVLLALGLRKSRLIGILGAALGYVVALASLLGVLGGIILFTQVQAYINAEYLIDLPPPSFWLYGSICAGLIAVIALSSFIPAVRRSLALNPKQILIGGENESGQGLPLRSLLTITFFTLLPLTFLASFLLGDIISGITIIGSIAVLYIVIAGGFAALLSLVYRYRARFPFLLRSIISQKKADGLFGIISFTSLFVALIALGTLALLQVSLERFLTNDLAETVPSTYVVDIQPSQKDEIESRFPDLELFSNIGARIIAIDNVRIQDELEAGSETVSRELGREFNLTARAELLGSETITGGVWGAGRAGEISVDEEFAKQANIELGSTIIFSVQGFEVQGLVTSLRSTDSRSGLPFFYFVLSPEDIGSFPGIYFGYSYYEGEKQQELRQFLATEMPNISVLETQTFGPLIIELVSTLLIMVLIVSLPPLLIATLLIATLVVSSYGARRREGARFRALGATRLSVLRQYLLETISLTLVSAFLAYFVSVVAAFAISTYFLGLDSVALFDSELVIGLSLIVVLVGLIGLYLFKTDTLPLRELLSYESNV